MVDLTITHLKVDTVADGADTSLVRPSDWNDVHAVVPSATPYAVIVGGTGSTSALQQVANLGSSGQVLTSAGTTALPTWTTVSSGTGTGSVTPAALTLVNDTNVTLAAAAASSAAVALLQTVQITAGWTGTLAPNRGGTGLAAAAPYAVIAAGTGSTTAHQTVAAGSSGQFLAYVSATTLPVYQSVSASNITTGTLPVERGGTAKTTFTTWALIAGGSGTTTALQSLASVGTSGQVLTSAGTTALPTWATPGAGTDAAMAPQGRLTLTSGTAITTSDVTGATTLYYTPAAGFYVPITTDGTNFTNTVFTELSQATTDTSKSPAATAADKIYDVYVWSDSGTVRATRGNPWTTDLSRGTGSTSSELDVTTKFPTNKFAITNGPAANRGVLVGSVRSNSSSQLVDTLLIRWVSNAYNTEERRFKMTEPTDNWNDTAGTWGRLNASSANQVDCLFTLPGRILHLTATAAASNTGGTQTQTGIGIDQVTANDADCWAGSVGAANLINPMIAFYNGYAAIGRHTAAQLEYSAAAGTTTWYGDAGLPGVWQTGMTGWMLG